MIRLFGIDDHFLILEGLGRAFSAENDEIELVGSAANVDDALKNIPGILPDIIILDLFIDDSDPVENFRRLHDAFPAIPIVILSLEDSLRWQVKMFKLGVMGYLNKGEKKDTMKSVFEQVAQGNLVIPNHVSQALISKTTYPK
jgi:DNA-binding NarL/FixJ family response regulator